jgi:hypothetical protein
MKKIKLFDLVVTARIEIPKGKPVLIADPLQHFNPDAISEIKDRVGILPLWAFETMTLARDVEVITTQDITKSMTDLYGYGVYESVEAKIDDFGIYTYPEDPDMYPLAFMNFYGCDFLFYEHAMVAWKGNTFESKFFSTRMD